MFVLKEIEYLLISLNKNSRLLLQSCRRTTYRSNRGRIRTETTRFIDQNQITRRLAKVRRVVSEKFNNGRGDDDMSDLEREMELLRYWEKPGG